MKHLNLEMHVSLSNLVVGHGRCNIFKLVTPDPQKRQYTQNCRLARIIDNFIRLKIGVERNNVFCLFVFSSKFISARMCESNI